MSFTKEQLATYANIPNYSDIEAIGFWEDVHTTKDIHVLCSVVEDPDTGEDVVVLFHDSPHLCGEKVWDEIDSKEYIIPRRAGSLMDGFRFWYSIGKSVEGYLSVHNAFGYDRPIVKKVVPKCDIPKDKWEDTFIKSKIQFFDRPCPKGAKSPHGLDAYGRLFGIKKPPITDFTTMTPYILHRVIEDCKIQKMTSEYLHKEFIKLRNVVGVDLTEAYKMEVDYTITCQEQEVYGAMADREHMERCVETWDERLRVLEDTIVPLLPPTIKVSGGKVTRKEMAIALGYPEKITDKMVEPIEWVKRGGELTEVKIKPYYKPTTKWTLEKKTTVYSGMHISHGFSPSFTKKTELTNWIKENHPDTKPKEWDITKTEDKVKLLNANTCKYFDLNPEDTHIIAGAHTKVKFVASGMTQHEVVKGMLIKGGITWAKEWNLAKDSDGKMIKAEVDTVISYPKKASYENQMHYTVKKGEPLVTSPKFGEDEYEQLETETGKMVGEYNTTVHRRRFLLNEKDPEEKGLIANIREDGRIPCGVNNFSTATGRSAHRIWVNAPGAGALYGEEVRRSLVAPEGRILVSHDMNSAQLSIAAYYANNYEYFQSVCFGQETKLDEKGNDILHPDTGKPWYIAESGHCTNMVAFGLVSPEEVQRARETQDPHLIHDIGLRRKKSKGATFGVIFGCSGKKLAQMLKIDEAEGNIRKNMFLEKIGLDRPIAILEQMSRKQSRGSYTAIELPFGYYAFCKSPHAFFNYLDQGTEAACQKFAEIYFDNAVKRLGLDAHRILSYHDEFTVECAVDIEDDVKRLMFEAYKVASERMWEWHKTKSKWFSGADCPDFHIELQSGSSSGMTYWDVH